MDGFNTLGAPVLVIGATNVKHVLDPALLRPGRFDRVIPMGLPSRQSRHRILSVHARNKQLPEVGSDVYPAGGEALLKWAADSTAGMSGADLENLLNEAAILSVRNETPTIGQAEIEAAMDKMRLGVAQPMLPPSDSKRQLAVGEAARGLMASLHPRLCPEVLQVSVRPRGSKTSRTVVVEAMVRAPPPASPPSIPRLSFWSPSILFFVRPFSPPIRFYAVVPYAPGAVPGPRKQSCVHKSITARAALKDHWPCRTHTGTRRSGLTDG